MTEPRWLSIEEVLWIHELQIRGFGGPKDVRDIGLLEAALMRVRNRFFYRELTSVSEVAVAYAAAINANHPFIDGNKRVSFHCLLVFLRLHGFALSAEPAEATDMMLGLAAGQLAEAEITAWVKAHLVKTGV